MEKPKSNKVKAPAAKPAPAAPAPAPVPLKVAPLFRGIDWFVLLFCFAVVWMVYLYMLAPDETLEDSGELCTASFYAGIPHPPGYPFWSIYSWLWTLLPFGSVAWRVEVGESFAAAMACGLVGLMVSRGSSMLIEGIEELKQMDRKWEGVICIACGIAAGLLLGFDDYAWKESVVINRISLFDVPWLMVVAVCLMRWIYAPHQKRYLYVAMFFFGVCATIHQTMLCAAMGLEVAVAFTSPKLGRTFFLGNSVVFLGGLILIQAGAIPVFTDLSPTLLGIFAVVGVASIAAYVWLAILTKESFNELSRDGAITASFLFLTAAPSLGGIAVFLSIIAFAGFVVMAVNTWKQDHGWLVMTICAALWALGVSFYFYEAISGMTDPPMQWGYPRTVEGFFHAISRGQYEKANPTDFFHDPMRFLMQLGLLISGLANSYTWVLLFVAMLPFLFLFKMQKRERAWLIGLTALYFCVGILLCMLMNTTPDLQTEEENKVFFTASHAIIAILIGYGLALMSAYMATHYASFRKVGLILGAFSVFPALLMLYNGIDKTFYGNVGALDYRQVFFLFVCMTASFVLAAMAIYWFKKIKNAPQGSAEGDWVFFWVFVSASSICFITAVALAFFGEAQLSMRQILSAIHRIFAPDQYSLPVLAGLLIIMVVFFYLASLLVYRNRAPILISLGLFLLLPVSSFMSHWAGCEQRNHWFGFYFGHDMFTPPFVGPDGKLSYDAALREKMMKGPNGDLVYPEMDRNTILFGGTDPGRFCPTYMIFCESFVPPKDKPMDPAFNRRDVYLITQNALADGTYLDYLRAQYFRSQQKDPVFFSELIKYVAGLLHMDTDGLIIGGLADAVNDVLDVPFTKLGAHVEAKRRAEGVYPPSEIYIPSPEDSAQCFQAYVEDVQQRQAEGRLDPGEDAVVDPASGRVAVSGQVAVMMINGLLCKVIFDKNPTNEFYVEESFPLKWMYPYETPYGIIMKINRKPLERMPEENLKRDHAFWSAYSDRLIGNWITYDTPIQQITNFVHKVYMQHNYSGFKGDYKFLRDQDAQKAFSKLRDSQGGMYAWRLQLLIPNLPTDPQYLAYRPKSEEEVEQLYKECDFAFKQSFAFCPYSPETVVRYVNFLYQFNRFDDAQMVAETCHELDPYNPQISDLLSQIERVQVQVHGQKQPFQDIQQMEAEARDNPTNVDNLLSLGTAYAQMQQPERALEMFNRALTNPSLSFGEAAQLAQFYSKMGYSQLDKLEIALKKITIAAPNEPEAFYDLAALEAIQGKTTDSLDNLRISMDLSAKRLKTDPNAHNLAATNRTDSRFDGLRSLRNSKKSFRPGSCSRYLS